MATTKYPILLVHGIMLKDFGKFKAFGKIEKTLREQGYTVYTSQCDGFGSIEGNAQQLKDQIMEILRKTGADKINLIAHSKGGLDSRYMIMHLGMSERIASLTCLCTPHKGSVIASKLYALPKPLKYLIATFLTLCYRLFGDKDPQVLTVCKQLSDTPDGTRLYFDDTPHDGIFIQSYSTTLKNSRDDFVMGIPLMISKKFEDHPSDGMVSCKSSQYGDYRGDCTDMSVSHSEIVDFMAKKSKKEKIYGFYLTLCEDLQKRGF